MEVILWLYVLQHAIFLVARPVLFIVYSIFTCCCDKGTEFSESEQFEDRIISYKYIENETENHGNFEHHQRNPIAEMSYQRSMSQVSQRAAARQEEELGKQEMSASAVRRASLKASTMLQHKLSITQKGNTCPICAFDFKNGATFCALGCHPRHILHEHCYDELTGFFKDNAACPLCRAPIKPEMVVKKIIENPQQNANPFADKQNNADNTMLQGAPSVD